MKYRIVAIIYVNKPLKHGIENNQGVFAGKRGEIERSVMAV